jgi:2-phospho-L-lactate/phosphoenolpyruvate guanylyltransferase
VQTSTPWVPWVIVPVKSFRFAKQRLASVLSPEERHALAATLAAGVIKAAAPWPVLVINGDNEVAELATSLGAKTIDDPGQGLNNAIVAGVSHARLAGASRVVIVHADLPLAAALPQRLALDGLTAADVLIVPDRHLSGTNVMSIPTNCDFTLHYGVGSFAQHLGEATARGLRVIQRRDRRLSLDIDTPDDLSMWRATLTNEH